MAEIINLRRQRKARARKAETDAAAANRVAFGLTRAERNAARTALGKALAAHDGHKRDG